VVVHRLHRRDTFHHLEVLACPYSCPSVLKGRLGNDNSLADLLLDVYEEIAHACVGPCHTLQACRVVMVCGVGLTKKSVAAIGRVDAGHAGTTVAIVVVTKVLRHFPPLSLS